MNKETNKWPCSAGKVLFIAKWALLCVIWVVVFTFSVPMFLLVFYVFRPAAAHVAMELLADSMVYKMKLDAFNAAAKDKERGKVGYERA